MKALPGTEKWNVARNLYKDIPSSRWTQYPRQHKYEAFSSWFSRIAKLNCADTVPLFHALLGMKIPFTDIERKVDVKSALIKKLETYVDITSMKFNKLQSDALLREDIHGATRILDNYLISPKYCPLCLNDDIDPYFRIIWHLPFVTVCPIHHILLFNQCPSCHYLIKYWETKWNKAINTCFKCEDDLMNNYDFISTNRNPDKMHFQDDLLEIYKKGIYRGQKIDRPVFFQQLYTIVISEKPFISKDDLNTNTSLESIFRAFRLAFFKIVKEYAISPPTHDQAVKKCIDVNVIKKQLYASLGLKDKGLDIAEFRYRIIKPFLDCQDKSPESAQCRARDGGISLGTFYKWILCYKHGGLTALAPKYQDQDRPKVSNLLSEEQLFTEDSLSMPYQNCFTCMKWPPREDNIACQKCIAELGDKYNKHLDRR